MLQWQPCMWKNPTGYTVLDSFTVGIACTMSHGDSVTISGAGPPPRSLKRFWLLASLYFLRSQFFCFLVYFYSSSILRLLISSCSYDFYSFSIIPTLGELVAGDRESYQYLVESIRRFPSQVYIQLPLEYFIPLLSAFCWKDSCVPLGWDNKVGNWELTLANSGCIHSYINVNRVLETSGVIYSNVWKTV